jgi:hypothetical protein
MILVKIELHSARTGQVTELGRMQITNNGIESAHNPNRGDYIVELFRKGSTTKVQRKGLVRDYPRLSYTVWELVRRSLEAALGRWPIHPGRPEEFGEEVREISNQRSVEQTIEAAQRKLENMTPKELFQLAVDAGIYNSDGSLTKPYRSDDGFTLGSTVEPGVISEEFKEKCKAFGLDLDKGK